MARIAIYVTVIFLLFTLSHAQTPLDFTEHDRVPSITVPESDTKTTTILLPSEKPDTEPNTVVEFEPVVTSSEIDQEIFTEPIQELDGPDLIGPLTIVSIRPINRHRSPHRCHHHHQHRREIPYGNDMLVANEYHHDDVTKFDDPTMFHEEFHHHRDRRHESPRFQLRQEDDMLVANEDHDVTKFNDPTIFHEEFHHHRDHHHEDHDVTKFDDPMMFHEEFHHHGDHHRERSRFSIRHEDGTMMKMKRPFFFHHQMPHHHHLHMEEVEDVKHEKGFGWMKRVRMFFNHF